MRIERFKIYKREGQILTFKVTVDAESAEMAIYRVFGGEIGREDYCALLIET